MILLLPGSARGERRAAYDTTRHDSAQAARAQAARLAEGSHPDGHGHHSRTSRRRRGCRRRCAFTMSCRHMIDARLGWQQHGAGAQQGLRPCSAPFSDHKIRARSERVHEHPLVESVTLSVTSFGCREAKPAGGRQRPERAIRGRSRIRCVSKGGVLAIRHQTRR